MNATDQSLWRVAVRVGLFAWRCVTVAREMIGAQNSPSLAAGDHQARRIQHLARQLCGDHGIDVVVEGKLPNGPAVFVANHVSHVDPLVVATLRPLLPIAKGEISRWPFIGRVGRYLGILFVKRDSVLSGAGVLRRSLRALQRGVSVLNFPEGTTTFGRDVLPFRRGIFGVAAIAGVPVIPTALRFEPQGMAWVGDAYFVAHCLRAFSQSRWTAYVSFGKALRVEGEVVSADQLAELSRCEITRLLANDHCHQTSHSPASPAADDAPRRIDTDPIGRPLGRGSTSLATRRRVLER